VADDDERALEAPEPRLEPVDRREVEVVGRLVEQQHVGIDRERADDCRAAPLAAAGGRRGTAEVDADLVGDRGSLVWFGGAFAGEHPLAEGFVAGQLRVLLEQHDARTRDDRALALVGVDHPGEAFEQCRLARAIAPDQRQPVARPDVDVEPAEQPAFALDEAEVFERENWGSHWRGL
jgi:hypothetical protein